MAKKISKKKILDEVLKDIEAAEKYYSDVIIPKNKELMKIYLADVNYYNQKFARLSRESNFTIEEVASTIEAILPDIMKVVFGTDRVISVNPVGPEDIKDARALQKLIDIQIQKLNSGYKVLGRWIKAALMRPVAALKCEWTKEKRTERVEIVIDEQNPQDLLVLDKVGGNILERKPEAGGLTRIVMEIEKVIKDQPTLEYLMADEFIFLPDALDINDVSFAAQRKIVTSSELRESPFYDLKDVEKAIKNAPDEPEWEDSADYTEDASLTQVAPKAPFYDNYLKYRGSKAKGRKPIVIHECYGRYDTDGDGILEDMLITVANKNTIIRMEENPYGRPPFFVLYPLIEPDTPVPKTITELAAIFQHVKIALMRQVIVNTAKSNSPRIFYDVESGIGKWLEDDYQYIPVRTGASQNIHNLIKQEEIKTLAPWTFDLLERNENDREMVTGVTRHYQGMDPRSLNKTATGISIITQQSQRRVEIIARNLIETGLRELFRFLVSLNGKFVEPTTVRRILNDDIDLAEVDERFDVEVDVGIGFGDKVQQQNALAVVGNFYPAFVNNLQIFIQFPEFYEKFRAYFAQVLQNNNIKDVNTYLPTVEEVQEMSKKMEAPTKATTTTGLSQGGVGGNFEPSDATSAPGGLPPEMLAQLAARGQA